MARYIEKGPVVEEIEKRLHVAIRMSKSGKFSENNPVIAFAVSEYKELLSFLETLEAKEEEWNGYYQALAEAAEEEEEHLTHNPLWSEK